MAMEKRVQISAPGGAVGGLVAQCQSMVDDSSQYNANLEGFLANHQYNVCYQLRMKV